MSSYANLEEYNIQITNEIKERYLSIIEEIGEETKKRRTS